MSTVPPWATPISRKRSECKRAAIPHLRESAREELDRQEIEAAVISAKADATDNPVDAAWQRCARQCRLRSSEPPQGIVVSAVREWLAKRGLDRAFDVEELEEWVGDWCSRGGRSSWNPNVDDLRTESGGDDDVL